MESSLTPSESVTKLVGYFEEAEQTTYEARQLSERDRDYYDNKQWTDDEIKALNKRRQPVVTFNRIQRKIDFLSGLEKQQRKDPKAFPRNPDDEAAANAATDALRYVCEDQNWDEVRSAAWDNLLIEGTCAVMVDVQQTKAGYDPALRHIPWDRFFADPKSSQPDYSDARYMGIVTWYDLDVAREKWPDAEDSLEATMLTDAGHDTYEDKPRYRVWAEARSQRVRVVEIYHKEKGQWMRCVYTRGGYLEEPKPSPYINEDGEPENPIEAISLYIDRDNNRYGAVRVLISPQDEINKRRSKGLHLITMRQARVGLGAAQDAEKIRKELAKPDGIVEADRDDFEILDHNDMAQWNLNMLQEAKNEIDLLGANAALSGKNENDMSGRALLAQQQGGMVEVARAFDRLRSLSIEVYRSIWNRIRQVWPNERWVRVTDDERNLRFVGLNQQVTVNMLAQEVAQGDQEAIAKAAQIVGPQLMQAYMAGDEQAQVTLGMFVQQNANQVVEVRNAINELDVDIVIDEGMDTPTVQAEQFDALVKMLPAFGPFGQHPKVLEGLVEASQLRNKDKFLEAIQQAMQPQADPMAEQMQQIQMAGEAAKVEETQSKTAKNMAQAASSNTGVNDPVEEMLRAAEVDTKQYDAVTKRMQVMKPEPRAAA